MKWFLEAYALWSIAAAAGIIIAAPHNNSFGRAGAVAMIALLLGLISAASFVFPFMEEGSLRGGLKILGGVVAYVAGVFYASEGMHRK